MTPRLSASPHKLEEMLKLGISLPEWVDPRAKNAFGQDLLGQAAALGLPKLLAAALPLADLASRDYQGMSALHLAARAGELACLKPLLGRFEIDEPADSGRSALMHAAQAQSPSCLRALLKAGADPKRLSRGGWTALMFAAKEAHFECFELLLPLSDPAARNDSGHTALGVVRERLAQLDREDYPAQFTRYEAIELALSSNAAPRSAAPSSPSI